MIYYIVYFLTKFISFFLFPRRMHGTGHIPAQGGFIIASNHISNLDPVVLGISCIRRINFMAKIELFAKKKEPLGFILKKLGAFPVKREEADFGALKEAIKRLKGGKPVLIFIEGTRRISDEPSKAQPGVGFLAVKANVPVIPVYIEGTQKVMSPGCKKLTRHPVHVRFGPPVQFNPQAPYEVISDTILQHIYKIAS